ncbi:MAG: ATP-binding cassette domain-containing protein [Actinomycetota bacterium]
MGRRGAVVAGREWRTLHALSSRYAELLHGLATIRLLRQEAASRNEIEAATTSFGTATIAALRVAFRSSLVAEFMAGAAVGLAAMLLGFRLMAGQVSLAHALAILLLAGEVYAPLRRVNAEFHAASSGREAASMLFALLGQPVPAIVAGATVSNDKLLLDHFSVSLETGEPLEPLTASIGLGVGLHLTGPSGAGKTTVLHAIARSLGTNAAIAPQHPYLFSGTLLDNLLLANPYIDRSALMEILSMCQLEKLIDALPEGLQTTIGDGGLQLSSGERQRIGLARALVAKRPVLLLDEAGSHLDPETLDALRHALKSVFEQSIVIEVAHSHAVVSCALRQEVRLAR